jgi:DNA-binding HxlR family transcriptional regulator
VVGERWSLLILRVAHGGVTRFAGFQANLGIATNVLMTRLGRLVAAGVFEKREYQILGERAHLEYHLTRTGRELSIVFGALQQGATRIFPCRRGRSPSVRTEPRASGLVSFVDEHGSPIDSSQVKLDGRGRAGSK